MELTESKPLRLVSLSHALADATILVAVDQDRHVFDASAALEEERARVLRIAAEEGLAQGMLEAERSISDQVAAIEERLSAEHDARMKSLQLELDRFSALTRAIPEALDGMDRQIASTVVEVAFCALTRAIGQRWADKEILADLCRNIIEEHRLSPGVLRVSPDDIARISDLPTDIQVVPDARLQPGQCVIESAKGCFMTGLDVRLNALRDALLDGLRQTVSP